jgi:hypothetical protein
VKDSLLRCDSISLHWDTGEKLLAIVEISEEGVYAVTEMVVAAFVVAAALVAAVVVSAAGVESRLVTVLVVPKEVWKSMASLSSAPMTSIDVNGISVVGYV